MQTLKEIKKNIDLEKIKQAVRWFSQEDIISYLFFIIGFPNDTRDSIMKTIDFACEANPTGANFSSLVPFPGTEIYSLLKDQYLLKDGLDDGIMSGFNGGKLYHSCQYLTEEQIIDLQALAYRRFYLRPSKIIEHLQQIRSFSEMQWYLNVLKTSFPMLSRLKIKQ